DGYVAIAAMFEIFVERVDLPHVAIGIVDPELRLAGVAAFDPFFALGADAGTFEPPLHLNQRRRIGHAEAEMVQVAPRLSLERLQRQHERRIVELKLGIIGSALRRLDAEERTKKLDRLVEVADVEREMKLRGRLRCLGSLLAGARTNRNHSGHQAVSCES